MEPTYVKALKDFLAYVKESGGAVVVLNVKGITMSDEEIINDYFELTN